MWNHFHHISEALPFGERFGVYWDDEKFMVQLTDLENKPEVIEMVNNEAKKVTELCRVIVLPDFDGIVNINILDIGV
jgi:hypothetical protein